ncbi:hypothetical protein Btru_023114 [Bulinus truncatus]|nr:hypothetical protein Btru_023114 [Bulinus truncatus]
MASLKHPIQYTLMPNLILCCIISVCFLKTRITDARIIGCDEFSSEFQDKKVSCDVYEEKFDEFLQASRKHCLFGKTANNKKHNDISIITGRKTGCCCENNFCDCSSLNLTDIPKNLSMGLTMLSLAKNLISVLPNCSFCNYEQLTFLDLSSNKLARLDVGSFWKLERLEYLSLKSNSLIYVNNTFPHGVFSDLQAVTCLKINRNTDPDHRIIHYYPDGFLSEFISLETLYLDGLLNVYFGRSFRQLTRLKNLILAGSHEGYCKIVGLREDAFENVAQITLLNISDCLITGEQVDTRVLVPLVNLTDLDVSYNINLGVEIFLHFLNVVRTYNITRLRMNFIQTRYFAAVTVTESMIRSLPAALNYLEARGNNFITIQTGILGMLPFNLSYLDAGSNIFLYGQYVQELPALSNLKVLRINGQFKMHDVPKYQPHPSATHLTLHLSDEMSQDFGKDQPFIISLPPNLLCLEMRNAELRYVMTEINFNESNILQTLSLEKNYLPILYGPFKGLNKLKKLDLSYCSVDKIFPQFFKYLDKLEEIKIIKNNLGPFLKFDNNEQVLRYLKGLKVIDLSNNALSVVFTKLFEFLNVLEEIDLSMNDMREFNVDITNILNLRKLNLSHLELSSLPVATRQHIDTLLKTNSVVVDMSSNPILCDCNNLDFIKWMVNSKAFDSHFKNYMCQFPDSSYKYIDDSYQETLYYLNVQCSDTPVIVVSATLCLVTFVAAVILYRFRWKIRYLYHAAYVMFKRRENVGGDEEQFIYDAFLSYAYQDEEFILDQVLPELTKRDLKVLVHGRDFAVGEFIASNIVTAVKESRKTLVVVTRDLLKSTWCNFELQMANMESVHTGRSVLVFLIKETIPSREMTSDLLKYVNNNTYIVYPQEEISPVFWDKLAKDLLLP